jgi:hypothetical protein
MSAAQVPADCLLLLGGFLLAGLLRFPLGHSTSSCWVELADDPSDRRVQSTLMVHVRDLLHYNV